MSADRSDVWAKMIGASGPGTFLMLLLVGYLSRDSLQQTQSNQAAALNELHQVREVVQRLDERLIQLEEDAARERTALEARLQSQLAAERSRVGNLEERIKALRRCHNERRRRCP